MRGWWLLLLVLPLRAFPAPAPLPLNQFAIDTWDVEQGLPSSTVNAVVQDRAGYIWAGTYEGVVRFDGLRLTLFDTANTPGLGSDGVRALLVDDADRLWVGTNGGGLSVREGSRFRTFALGPHAMDQMVWSLARRRAGGIWAGTNGGAVVAVTPGEGPQERARLPAVHAIFGMHEDAAGVLWVATQGDGLWRLSPDGAWQRAEGIPHHDVRVVRDDGEGGLLVGTLGGGLLRLGPRDRRILDQGSGLPSDSVYDVAAGADGTLWVATAGGLGRVQGDRVEAVARAQGLHDELIYSLVRDNEGNVWGGTSGGGLFRLRAGAISHLGVADGLSHDVAYPVLEEADGSVLVGTKGGVDRVEGGRITPVTARGGPCSSEVRALARSPDGALWIGTYGGGVCRMAGGRTTVWRREDGLGSDTVRAILPRRDGSVWVGTVQGLSRWDGRRFTNLTTAEGLPHDSVMCLHEDRAGVLWIGTSGGGLVRGPAAGDAGPPRFAALGVAEGLASSVVFSIREDGDVLWVGTNAGISRVRGGVAASITPARGLPVSSINQLVDDGAGSLWVGSARGILRLAKSDLHAVLDGRQERVGGALFGRDDGLRSAQCSVPTQPAGLRTRDGRLWFTTLRGIAILDPRLLRPDPVAPGVALEDVTLDDRPLDTGGPLRLGPGPDRLALRYTGLCPSHPERVRFRYQLEGFDEAPVDAGASREAHYTRLPPGRYRFHVQAANGDGVWNEEGATLEIEVQPFLWQTRGFLAAAALAGMLAVGGLHRLRTRTLRARAAELSGLVEERTRDAERRRRAAEEASALKTEILGITAHDLARPLGALLDALASLRGGGVPSADQVSAFAQHAERMRHLLQEVLAIASLESGRVTLQLEELDARRLLDDVARDLEVAAHTKEQQILVAGPPLPLRGDELRLTQILDHLVSNALKFSPPGATVWLDVEPWGRGARFRVRDQGPGLSADDQASLFRRFTRLSARPTGGEASLGLGLSIVKRLVELHGGTVRAESEGRGHGAAFVVELPREPPTS